jgi:F-box protein 9
MSIMFYSEKTHEEQEEEEKDTDEEDIIDDEESEELKTFRESWRKDLGLGRDSNEPKKSFAIQLYHDAMVFEHEGKLNDALKNYRAAIRMDPEVDLQCSKLFETHVKNTTNERNCSSSSLDDKAIFETDRNQEMLKDTTKTTDTRIMDILRGFSEKLHLSEIDDDERLLVDGLPYEVLVHIFRWLIDLMGTSWIPILNRVCRQWYVVSHDPLLWQHICERTWTREDLSRQLARYGYNYRRMYLEKGRPRFDGIYIARINYFKSGYNEMTWSQPIILVTYYRYLRFYPDGNLISLLTSDEPVKVLKQFKEGHLTGILEGTYRLKENLVDIVLIDELRTKETFHMRLELRSTSRSGNNQLRWRNYYSKSHSKGTVYEFNRDQLKSYWFSRVRSFTPYSP